MAQTAISALSLPLLVDTHGSARVMFVMSLGLSLLAIFFTCVQQRELGFVRRPSDIRAWLSNGIRYNAADGSEAFQSSMAAHHLLQSPHEMMGVSITVFIAGLGVYLGSAWARDLNLGVINDVRQGNVAVLGAFIAVMGFASMLFGFLLGQRSVDNRKSLGLFESHGRIEKREY